MKLINFHSLTERIQALVQGATGRKASVNTLVVAIKRFSDTLPDNKMRTNRTSSPQSSLAIMIAWS